MKIFFSVLIAISMSVGLLYANEKVDSLSIIKIKKLIQKEIKEHFQLYSPAEKYDMHRTIWNVILELPIENKGEII